MENARCPVCDGNPLRRLYPIFQGTGVSSDFAMVPNMVLDNRVCGDCGLIFNARGVRGNPFFYKDSYSLLMFHGDAEIHNFTEAGQQSQAERSADLFLEYAKLSVGARILECGAGKGHFAHYVKERRPDLIIDAFEPSASFEELKNRLPADRIRQCDYMEYDADVESYDAVVSMGVLEHVENPLHFLTWKRLALKPGGICYIRVPNFANNPNDLFTVDHLSKLTTSTMSVLAKRSGFAVEEVKTGGVPMLIGMRRSDVPAEELGNALNDNLVIISANERYAENAISTISETRARAHSDGSNWAIFGLAAAGLAAPYLLDFDASEIAAYVDENQSFWDSEVHGRPIVGLERIRELEIQHIALVVSPVYHKKIASKLMKYGVTVHMP